VPDNRHARDILLGTRFELDLYVNYRPVRLLDDRLSPLKNRGRGDINFVVFRENTEGVYVGVGGRFKAGTDDEVAIQEEVNTYKGVHRIIRHAFEHARTHRRTRVTAVHKANIMKMGDGLFLESVRKVAAGYPDITFDDRIVDAACMHLVMNPTQFDILLLPNLYGDIVSDLCAGLVGGLGVVPAANLGTEIGVFEAVHGSAPDIAGRNVANPTALLLSALLMLRHIGEGAIADRIMKALGDVLREGKVRTRDLGGRASTTEYAEAICRALGV
jgi:isocitrate/isopropylmalate dehydrogenase